MYYALKLCISGCCAFFTLDQRWPQLGELRILPLETPDFSKGIISTVPDKRAHCSNKSPKNPEQLSMAGPQSHFRLLLRLFAHKLVGVFVIRSIIWEIFD